MSKQKKSRSKQPTWICQIKTITSCHAWSSCLLTICWVHMWSSCLLIMCRVHQCSDTQRGSHGKHSSKETVILAAWTLARALHCVTTLCVRPSTFPCTSGLYYLHLVFTWVNYSALCRYTFILLEVYNAFVYIHNYLSLCNTCHLCVHNIYGCIWVYTAYMFQYKMFLTALCQSLYNALRMGLLLNSVYNNIYYLNQFLHTWYILFVTVYMKPNRLQD